MRGAWITDAVKLNNVQSFYMGPRYGGTYAREHFHHNMLNIIRDEI